MKKSVVRKIEKIDVASLPIKSKPVKNVKFKEGNEFQKFRIYWNATTHELIEYKRLCRKTASGNKKLEVVDYKELQRQYKQHANEYAFKDLNQVIDKIKGLNHKRFENVHTKNKGTYNKYLEDVVINDCWIRMD